MIIIIMIPVHFYYINKYFIIFTSSWIMMSLLLWNAPLTKYLEQRVNTISYTRVQITAVKFLMNSVHTPASGMYDIFFKY